MGNILRNDVRKNGELFRRSSMINRFMWFSFLSDEVRMDYIGG